MEGKKMFDLHWDINKYKSNYDPEYWDLCRSFMLLHKTKYPEQRLVLLTEAFYQIGVYGSSYDPKTTRIVSALAIDVLDDFLKSHPGTLKHPFDKTKVLDTSQGAAASTVENGPKNNQPSSIWDVVVDRSLIVNVLMPAHMRTLLKGFVIVYDVRRDSTMNDNRAAILEESFKRSRLGPCHWDKETTLDNANPLRLSLKWKGTLVAEGYGKDEKALSARLAQAVLSKIALFFPGVEAKWSYYRDGKLPDMFDMPNPRRSNIYKVMPRSQFNAMAEITSFIDTFANSDSFAEIIFGMDYSVVERRQIREYITKSWGMRLTYRTINKLGSKNNSETHVCMYQIKTGEELRRWLDGFSGENERYRIVPPGKHRRAGSCDKNVRELLKTDSVDLTEETTSVEEKKVTSENSAKLDESLVVTHKEKTSVEEKKVDSENSTKMDKSVTNKGSTLVEEKKITSDNSTKKEDLKVVTDESLTGKKNDSTVKNTKVENPDTNKKTVVEVKAVQNNENNQQAAAKNKADNGLEKVNEDNLEKLLEGFVLFYDAKKNSEINKDDWFSALCDSFKISKFGPLEVTTETVRALRTKCVMKWKGVTLASAEGLTDTQAKTAATLQLIAKLEPFTYIIQAKEDYFNNGKVPPFIENPDLNKKDVYSIVRRKDLPSYYTIFQKIDEFSKNRNFTELIFGADFTWELKNEIVVYLKAKGLDYRYFTVGDQKPWTHMALFHQIRPDELKEHLLSCGGENDKYKLIPPPKAEPIVAKTTDTPKPKDTLPKKPVLKVAEKRKRSPSKPKEEPEVESNKIQIKLKNFKKDKVEYPEDTGGDFPGLILWLGIKKNSTAQKNAFCILLESFKMSKYGELVIEETEENVWGKKVPMKKCVVKSNRKVLAVGLGETKTEGKNSAACQIIRQLRKHCYAIQAKESYYKEGKATPFDFNPDPKKSNVYRLVKRTEFKDRGAIIKYIDNFAKHFKSEEIIFGDDFTHDERESILFHCRQINFNYRLMKCQSASKFLHTHVAIYHQAPLPTIKADLMTCDGENNRYRLVPPRGKITNQASDEDIWPDTLEDETKENPIPPLENVKPADSTVKNELPVQNGPKNVSKSPITMSGPQKNTAEKKNPNRIPEKKIITVEEQKPIDITNQPLAFCPIPHQDAPLAFGPQPQFFPLLPVSAEGVPESVCQLQPMVVPELELSSDLVIDKNLEKVDLREGLEIKRLAEERKVSERKIVQKEENRDGWSRTVFVAEPGTSLNEKVGSCEDLRDKLKKKDVRRDRGNQEKRMLRVNSPNRFRQKSPMIKRRYSPDRRRFSPEPGYRRGSPPRRYDPDRRRYPREQRIVREQSPPHWRSRSPIRFPPHSYDEERPHSHRFVSTASHDRALWMEVPARFTETVFMYKYVKQDSTTERDPFALLRATMSTDFNIDFEFIKKQTAIDEWHVMVEIIADNSDVHSLVGESFASSHDEAKLLAAEQAVDTVQKSCRIIEPNYRYFGDGDIPDFIARKFPKKTHMYEIIENRNPSNPLDRYTVECMFNMFMKSGMEDLFFLATDFSYLERVLVIDVANQLGLWWRLFGPRHPAAPPDDTVSTQHVCISKQKSALQLIRELLENGGSSEKYAIVDPRETRLTHRR